MPENKYQFDVIFLKEASDFISKLDEKASKKVLYNIWKSRITNDSNLFKKLNFDVWEFRTLHNKKYIRLFAF